jgi:hypothetical protein
MFLGVFRVLRCFFEFFFSSFFISQKRQKNKNKKKNSQKPLYPRFCEPFAVIQLLVEPNNSLDLVLAEITAKNSGKNGQK